MVALTMGLPIGAPHDEFQKVSGPIERAAQSHKTIQQEDSRDRFQSVAGYRCYRGRCRTCQQIGYQSAEEDAGRNTITEPPYGSDRHSSRWPHRETLAFRKARDKPIPSSGKVNRRHCQHLDQGKKPFTLHKIRS